MKNRDRLSLIRCPHCNTEYLPEEIYTPNGFFGHPEEIERTYDGRISFFDGKSLDTHESFICESCGNPFEIEAQIRFVTYSEKAKDFSTDYSTQLYVNRISLFEN